MPDTTPVVLPAIIGVVSLLVSRSLICMVGGVISITASSSAMAEPPPKSVTVALIDTFPSGKSAGGVTLHCPFASTTVVKVIVAPVESVI